MRFFTKKSLLFMISSLGLIVMFLALRPVIGVQAQQQETATPGTVTMTVVYDDRLNVRAGPHSVYYDVIGYLYPGDRRTVIGRSPAGEWIVIADPNLPNGRGWVYASPTYIELTPGLLAIIEPPPMPTPIIPTIDYELAAQFIIQPTSTRMPTFTPPPARTEIAFDGQDNGEHFPLGFVILVLAILGFVGVLVSALRRG